MRAGTTSLYRWLKTHPDVFMPNRKEAHYFEHVHRHKTATWDEYLSLFAPGAGRRAIGEASPSYLSQPESAAWIKFVLPEAKIIILLREPADRAWSHYRFAVMRGYEGTPVFETALRRDRACRPDADDYLTCYFHRGLYAAQVRRYLDAFGPQGVLPLLFDDLISRPADTYRRVCRFLGVGEDFTPEFSHDNPGHRPRFLRANLALLKWGERARSWRVTQLCQVARKLNYFLGPRRNGLSAETRNWLRGLYREDVESLGELLNRDLSSWAADRRP